MGWVPLQRGIFTCSLKKTLLWQFTLAWIKMGRIELAEDAVVLAEKRLPVDSWP
ncbi:hypothetical protein AAHE18_08G089500 [Arachis hypogaea]